VSLSQAALLLTVGGLFGIGLQRGRVHETSLVAGQMTFSHFVMLKMFLTACASSMLAFVIVEQVFRRKTVRSDYRENFGRGVPAVVLGASILGVGMALTGSCPGTVFAQLGAGAGFPALVILVGGIVGIYILSLVIAHLDATGSTFLTDGRMPASKRCLAVIVTGDENASPTSPAGARVTLAFSAILFSMVLALEYLVDYRVDAAGVLGSSAAALPRFAIWGPVVPPLIAGLIIGSAQLLASAGAGRALGTSSSYACVLGNCLAAGSNSNACSDKNGNVAYPMSLAKTHRFQVLVVVGIVLGAFVSALATGATYVGADFSYLRMFVGGICLTLGSQLCGGCTSGHGLTGLGLLSTTSAIAVCAMFGSAIGTGVLIKLFF